MNVRVAPLLVLSALTFFPSLLAQTPVPQNGAPPQASSPAPPPTPTIRVYVNRVVLE